MLPVKTKEQTKPAAPPPEEDVEDPAAEAPLPDQAEATSDPAGAPQAMSHEELIQAAMQHLQLAFLALSECMQAYGAQDQGQEPEALPEEGAAPPME